MGLEIPEAYGGSGGTFFMAVLAIEEFSRVDASAGVVIDVQNTLVIERPRALGQRSAEAEVFPASRADTVGAYALSEPSAGSDAFALADAGPPRATTLS